MLRAIREIKPVWVVGENVRGLISWNGGMVFDEVQADLENEGYEIIPFLLPACAVNAPHKRERVWFIAYSQSNGDRRRLCNVEKTYGRFGKPEKHGKNESEFRDTSAEPNVTNTNSIKLQGGATRSDPKRQSDTLAHHIHGINGEPGKTFQLNPLFVAEMMGFPVNWTELPFQNGETKV